MMAVGALYLSFLLRGTDGGGSGIGDILVVVLVMDLYWW